jgi:hypothetical protein
MVEQILKIIGMKLVRTSEDLDEALVELTLLPLSNVELKPMSIMKLATGGTNKIMQEMMKQQQFETKLIITQRQWLQEIQNQPYTNLLVTVDIKVDKLASEIAKG